MQMMLGASSCWNRASTGARRRSVKELGDPARSTIQQTLQVTTSIGKAGRVQRIHTRWVLRQARCRPRPSVMPLIEGKLLSAWNDCRLQKATAARAPSGFLLPCSPCAPKLPQTIWSATRRSAKRLALKMRSRRRRRGIRKHPCRPPLRLRHAWHSRVPCWVIWAHVIVNRY